MDMRLVIRAEVFEGDSVLGNQEITLSLPDTDDSQSALNCLAEGQINFSKIAEQVGIAAVWIAARELQKRMEVEEAAEHDKELGVVDLPGPQ
jgi:hypothetical protein